MAKTTPVTERSTPSAEAASLSWSDLSAVTWVKIAIIAVLFYGFFYEELNRIVRQWLDPTWSHGFLIPLFSLYFLHQRRNAILTLTPKPNYLLGLGGLLFFLVLYVLNVVLFKFGYGRSLIMLAALGSIVLFLGGWPLIRYTWLPVFFLFFAIPLPTRLYSQLTIPMRRWAAEVSTIILNLVPNLQATCQGVVIDVMYKGVRMEPGLDVAEACSGMRLLTAFVALGVAMAYLHERPFWQRLVLLISTVPIAIFCNIVRVTITGFIYILWDPQYAQGAYHDMLGLAMLPLAFLLYGALGWLMSNLFVEEEETPAEVIIARQGSPETDENEEAR